VFRVYKTIPFATAYRENYQLFGMSHSV